jgi:hypothetical protein
MTRLKIIKGDCGKNIPNDIQIFYYNHYMDYLGINEEFKWIAENHGKIIIKNSDILHCIFIYSCRLKSFLGLFWKNAFHMFCDIFLTSELRDHLKKFQNVQVTPTLKLRIEKFKIIHRCLKALIPRPTPLQFFCSWVQS